MEIYSFETLDSTNEYLKENYFKYNEYDIISTKIQPKGKGRYGSVWISQEGMALFTFYFKCVKNSQQDYLKIPLVVGMSAVKVLRKYAQLNYKLKWTNDIYLMEKKLGGILVEKKENNMFVGIGLNINNEMPEEVKNIGISLWNTTLKKYDLKRIILTIVGEFKKNYEEILENKGEWLNLVKEINEINYLKNKEITLRIGSDIISGIAGDVDENGQLEIKTEGIIKKISSGEVLKERIILVFNGENINTKKVIHLKKQGYDIVFILFISDGVNQEIIDNFNAISMENMLKSEKIYIKRNDNQQEYIKWLEKKYNAKLFSIDE